MSNYILTLKLFNEAIKLKLFYFGAKIVEYILKITND
jgi:hypothetical protein